MKKLSLLWLLLWVLNSGRAQDLKPNIVYIFDPLCSWCYTFSPILEKLQVKYKDRIDFTVVTGGMVLGEKVKTISIIADYILAEYPQMEARSGVKFGEPYLNLVKEGSTILHSEKACRAVVAFRKTKPDQAVAFSSEVQKLLFLKGSNLNEDSTYKSLARAHNLNDSDFLKDMDSDSVKINTLKDFKKVEEAGISGFPTLLLRINGEVIVITQGFEKYEKLEKKIDKILKQHNG